MTGAKDARWSPNVHAYIIHAGDWYFLYSRQPRKRIGHPVPILVVGTYNEMHKCMEVHSAYALNIDTYLAIRNAPIRRHIVSWRPGTMWRYNMRIIASAFSFHAGYHPFFPSIKLNDLSIHNIRVYSHSRWHDKNLLQRMRRLSLQKTLLW